MTTSRPHHARTIFLLVWPFVAIACLMGLYWLYQFSLGYINTTPNCELTFSTSPTGAGATSATSCHSTLLGEDGLIRKAGRVVFAGLFISTLLLGILSVATGLRRFIASTLTK